MTIYNILSDRKRLTPFFQQTRKILLKKIIYKRHHAITWDAPKEERFYKHKNLYPPFDRLQNGSPVVIPSHIMHFILPCKERAVTKMLLGVICVKKTLMNHGVNELLQNNTKKGLRIKYRVKDYCNTFQV